jgi:hypothetical protein
MKVSLQICRYIFLTAFVTLSALRADAFALLGPFQPWMQETNDFRQPGDIGGPMCLTNGYRWNVPVVTYGFDPSFVAFFGTNGEAAVESAIQIINDLPSVSNLALTNYPFNTTLNYGYPAYNLLDLKSWTLSLLLEQLGLAQPIRYMYAIREWNPAFITAYPTMFEEYGFPFPLYPDYLTERNFDPLTFSSTPYVNGILYIFDFYTNGNQNFLTPVAVDVEDNSMVNVPVANQSIESGYYYDGLTYDDVGGLGYLYSTNNVNYEYLLPGVSYAGKRGQLVNGAWRPGVNKITFVPQQLSAKSGAFQPMTILYTDTYISNGISFQQPLRRTVSQPDFLFTAGDEAESSFGIQNFSTTGTSGWANNAAANGDPNGPGPGVIQPPIQITFNKLGASYYSNGQQLIPYEDNITWGSYDDSTNPPVGYPIPQNGTNQMTFRAWLFNSGQFGVEFQKSFTWKPTSLIGTQYALQSSTDLKNWTTLFLATNNNTVWNLFIDIPSSGNQFYRLTPQ